MALMVYNTLSRRLEEFKPLSKGRVGVYVCGLTVYDYMHLGHARTYIAFDVILRYLRYRGYEVKYVQNVTDIDDKIIKKAGEKGVDPPELSREYAEKSLEDQEKLGLLTADAYPRVSDHIPDIIDAVKTLIKKGNAYVIDGGVYFDISTSSGYGMLSNQNTGQLNNHRIEPNPKKRTPLDFSLWKKSPEGELGFPSPWGRGRPGWHIECSVMSRKHLGGQFDIHGGALDLIFPHHENEIAQSEALSGRKPFVGYWLHTGFLRSSGEKMSKSLGNILPVREFLKKHGPQALRLFILQTHYRSPVDYSEENVANAEKAVERLKNFRAGLTGRLYTSPPDGGHEIQEWSENLKTEFIRHMDDDFNTPAALAALFGTAREVNHALSRGGESAGSLRAALEVFDEITGVLGLDVSHVNPGGITLSVVDKRLIEERERHRREGNWREADRIRDYFAGRGLRLVDGRDGTSVKPT